MPHHSYTVSSADDRPIDEGVDVLGCPPDEECRLHQAKFILYVFDLLVRKWYLTGCYVVLKPKMNHNEHKGAK